MYLYHIFIIFWNINQNITQNITHRITILHYTRNGSSFFWMNRKDSSKHRHVTRICKEGRLVHKSAWCIWRLRRQLPAATSSSHAVLGLAVARSYDWRWLAQAFVLGATETTTETTFFRSTDSQKICCRSTRPPAEYSICI